eukprot:472934_1
MSMSFDSNDSSPVESPQRIATQQEEEEQEQEGEIGSLFKRYNYATTMNTSNTVTMVIPRRSHSFPISFSPTKEKIKQSPTFHSQHGGCFLSSKGGGSVSGNQSMMDETHSKSHSQHPFEELKLAAAVTSHATKNKNMWNLNAIQFFPSYYSLERHHAYISNISNIANNNDVNDDKDDDKDDKGDDNCGGLDLLTSIASNISDCLKAEHVEIRYDPDETVVYCETSQDASQPDYCKFRINLFKKYEEERSSTGTSINRDIMSDSDDSSTSTIP